MTTQQRAAKVLQEIDAALALAEKATKGPWDKSRYHYPRFIVQRTNGQDNDAFPGVRSVCETEQSKPHDAAFIASSRTGWPTALRCLKTAIEGMLNSHAMLLKHDWDACELTTALSTLCDQWNQNDPH